jgi:hypothetical protein
MKTFERYQNAAQQNKTRLHQALQPRSSSLRILSMMRR